MMFTDKLNITELNYFSPKLPESFSGYKVLHISDLHSAMFGENQKNIIEAITQMKPDVIFITGDLIDRHNANISAALKLVRGALKTAPIYFVTGNHEWESESEGTKLMQALDHMGVQTLHDSVCLLERMGASIQIMGIDDPFMLPGKKTIPFNRISSENFLKRFIDLSKNKQRKFCVLLSHRPEFLHFYGKAQIDLVFSGHAHGGQIRMPSIGGLLAPHQGFFPKYTEGFNCTGNTSMIVSRGLGNSCFPFRINNPPELIMVTLKSVK